MVSFEENNNAHQSLKKDSVDYIITDEIFNPETIAALNEYYEIKNHPEYYKRYSSFKEGLDEVINH